jgi:hypothetical protein
VPGFQGTPHPTIFGPYAVQLQCEKYLAWTASQMPHEYLSDCWSDEGA